MPFTISYNNLVCKKLTWTCGINSYSSIWGKNNAVKTTMINYNIAREITKIKNNIICCSSIIISCCIHSVNIASCYYKTITLHCNIYNAFTINFSVKVCGGAYYCINNCLFSYNSLIILNYSFIRSNIIFFYVSYRFTIFYPISFINRSCIETFITNIAMIIVIAWTDCYSASINIAKTNKIRFIIPTLGWEVFGNNAKLSSTKLFTIDGNICS